MSEPIRLTQFSKGAGCGCKIAPAVLQEILANKVSAPNTKNLLVGNSHNDDAAVYDLQNGTALIVTADFFMPIVDDPFLFGKVAAANALSDVYAMGGKPITAIAILGWPIDKLSSAIAARVMEGASEMCKEAGIVISGGHTIDAPEPFFGLSVNGLIAIENIKQNSTAQEGDVILMSKPIGVGILATALKRGLISKDDELELVSQLTKLNSFGELLGKESSVHAMTDITGFGLLGHLTEMAEGSGLTAKMNYTQIPKLEAALAYARQGIIPDATYRNWNAYAEKVAMGATVDAMESFTLLPDPQTNGGLLIAVHPRDVDQMIQLGKAHQINLKPIGNFVAKAEKSILVD